jgi:hypothetical protein
MVTRTPQRRHILDQINKEIDELEKPVKALTGKDKAVEDEQGQINHCRQAKRQLTLRQFIKWTYICYTDAVNSSRLDDAQRWL